jgi:hypothetical protein
VASGGGDGLPDTATRLIYAFRDWNYEGVLRRGGTPSRLALRPFCVLKYLVGATNLRMANLTRRPYGRALVRFRSRFRRLRLVRGQRGAPRVLLHRVEARARGCERRP